MSKRNKNNGPDGGSDDNFGDDGDDGDDGNNGGDSREFDFSELLEVLRPSSLWHLDRHNCLERGNCATALLVDWACSGKTVGEGKFVFKNGNVFVYIPHARNLVAVLRSNVRYKVQEWVRNCEPCQFARCANAPSEDSVNDCEEVYPVGAKDASEAAAQLMLLEQALGEINDETKYQIVEMHICQGLTHKEIAKTIGMSHDNVRQIYSREMRRLRKLFLPPLRPSES